MYLLGSGRDEAMVSKNNKKMKADPRGEAFAEDMSWYTPYEWWSSGVEPDIRRMRDAAGSYLACVTAWSSASSRDGVVVVVVCLLYSLSTMRQTARRRKDTATASVVSMEDGGGLQVIGGDTDNARRLIKQ